MKFLSALASLTFALSLAAAPTFAHDAKSTEIAYKGKDRACCKKKHDERCEKDSAWAADSAECAKMDKENCHKGSGMSDSSACCKKHMKGEKKACCKKHEGGKSQKCCKKKEDDHCRKESATTDTSSPVAKQAIQPAKSK